MSDYYIWLLDRIGVLQGRYEHYTLLVEHLFSKEFTFVFSMDENRGLAGLGLRVLYASENGVYLEDVHGGPCSVLEMLESLAESMSFDTGDTIQKWFWEMLDNLTLTEYSDDFYNHESVEEILRVWLSREYDSSGVGSIFPVPNFKGDMRNLEIWDQKNVYMTTYYKVDNWLV